MYGQTSKSVRTQIRERGVHISQNWKSVCFLSDKTLRSGKRFSEFGAIFVVFGAKICTRKKFIIILTSGPCWYISVRARMPYSWTETSQFRHQTSPISNIRGEIEITRIRMKSNELIIIDSVIIDENLFPVKYILIINYKNKNNLFKEMIYIKK